MATGLVCLTLRLTHSSLKDWRRSYRLRVRINVSPLSNQLMPERVLIAALDLDIDDNTFIGFDRIRQRIAADDPARIEYSQQLSLLVRAYIYDLSTNSLKKDYSQAYCGGWPYHRNSNEPLPIQPSVLLVTSDFDIK
jgi:hypothetical protein